VAAPVDPRRVRVVRPGELSDGPIVYWMSRDQRAADNWALLYAGEIALRRHRPLAVVFCLAPAYLDAALRQYAFMLRGLEETAADLRRLAIPFFLLAGAPPDRLRAFVRRHKVGLVVADCSPLRINRRWLEEFAAASPCPVHQVDAHNIVPVWEASDKQEYAAYTLRPKIRRRLPEFLTDFPRLRRHPFAWPGEPPPVDWAAARRSLRVDRSVPEVDWLAPGPRAAFRLLRAFFDRRLHLYADHGHDPNVEAHSDLSPYLHFGQIAPQRVAWNAQPFDRSIPALEAFLEQLIVRRELSDNFCWYNSAYDSCAAFPEWARITLEEHRRDPRPRLYSRDQLEAAQTDDPLWNAAQRDLVIGGKMHSYLRMYWAKKILEWSPSPEEALAAAVALNDRYELDGRDPNGYAGIAWCIGGVHDRAFGARDVYGKIRCLSAAGARRKFDVAAYIRAGNRRTAGRNE